MLYGLLVLSLGRWLHHPAGAYVRQPSVRLSSPDGAGVHGQIWPKDGPNGRGRRPTPTAWFLFAPEVLQTNHIRKRPIFFLVLI